MTTAEATATLCNPKGLHMRATRELISLTRQFRAQVYLEHRGEDAPANSALELLTLQVGPGETVTIRAVGEDASDAVEAVRALIDCGFHELEPPPDGPQAGA